ncbi:YdeI/OmpD-associated family protein [Enterococcus xiangfangensis]|uniref:YdeI/OmpD-associated family protein n=1 Tax=Enterococcus xiangfangensis TaxID=1296537 RepID=UPI003D16B87A
MLVKRGQPLDTETFWYLDAVEEALCFGWIDSVHKAIPNFGHAQKLSPRKKKSPWSELNKERCRRLKKLGLMTNSGEAVLPDMNTSNFVIDTDILQLLKEDPELSRKFHGFPQLYQRIRIDAIQREKKKPAVYARMKENFIKNTKQNKMYGLWNDYGRLLDY